MESGEKCRITFELSLLKRLLSWILNDIKPMQPLVISIEAKTADGKPVTIIDVDNSHFKRFKVENIS